MDKNKAGGNRGNQGRGQRSNVKNPNNPVYQPDRANQGHTKSTGNPTPPAPKPKR